jgi:hypothetical protein
MQRLGHIRAETCAQDRYRERGRCEVSSARHSILSY